MEEQQVLRVAQEAGARVHPKGRVTVADDGISGAAAKFIPAFAKQIIAAHTASAASSLAEDAYWQQAMAQRMPLVDEVARLETVLYGFYCRQLGSEDAECSVQEFFDSKRPYGNKDIAESIAYNLGWDFERRLQHMQMPDWVRAEAEKLHAAVWASVEAARGHTAVWASLSVG
jgi:hypothetical protein